MADWAVAAAQSAFSFHRPSWASLGRGVGKTGERVARRFNKFRGQSLNKVDSKGRVSIPANFRRVLENCDPDWREGDSAGIVIVYGDHRRKYLECFSIEAIERIEERIEQMEEGSQERRLLEHLYTGTVVETSVDETGRLVLPAKLRNKIDLENEAFFIASGDRFKIWKPDVYDQIEAKKVEAALDALPEDFDPLIWSNKRPAKAVKSYEDEEE